MSVNSQLVVIAEPKSLKYHPAANNLPMMAKDARAVTRADIALKGIQEPIVVWDNPRGTRYVLDGRNRLEIGLELQEEGVIVQGKPLELPFVLFEGTEEEAFAYVITKGFCRRDMTSSQKAACFIRADHMARKWHKEKSAAMVEGDPEPYNSGDIAALVASLAGSNRTYVFKARKLHRAAPDLLDKVAEGELSIPQAMDALADRDKTVEEPDGDEGESDDPGAVVGATVVDGLGQEVAPEWVDVFMRLEDVRLIKAAIRTLSGQIEALAESPAGGHYDKKDLKGLLRQLKREIEERKPHCVCPHCGGSKKEPGFARKRCHFCSGHGYVTEKLLAGYDPEAEAQSAEAEEANGAVETAGAAAE
jgi:hypothetical protein